MIRRAFAAALAVAAAAVPAACDSPGGGSGAPATPRAPGGDSGAGAGDASGDGSDSAGGAPVCTETYRRCQGAVIEECQGGVWIAIAVCPEGKVCESAVCVYDPENPPERPEPEPPQAEPDPEPSPSPSPEPAPAPTPEPDPAPTSDPPGGACDNEADLAILETVDAESAANECGVGCLNADDIHACSETCIVAETGLSQPCASCFADVVVCVVEQCFFPCSQPESPACAACIESACIPPLEACSGLDLPPGR